METQARTNMTKRTIFGRNSHYQFRDQDPILDLAWYIARISGLSIKMISERSGISTSTLRHWFIEKKTISPRHDTIKIYFNAMVVKFGFENEPQLMDPIQRKYRKRNVSVFKKMKAA